MSIWNKVLVGVISLAAVFLFYLAARALKAETAWSLCALNHQKRIQQLEKQNHDLAEGTDTQPGIRQLSLDVHKLLLDRRRMWYGCNPTTVKVSRDEGTAEITATVNLFDDKGQAAPHGIAKGTVLYAFEELNVKNKGQVLGEFDVGQYLGEFAVTKANPNDPNDKQVNFKPTSRLNTREVDRLPRAKRPWVLYELLPRDDHEIYASLSDAQKKALLPADSVREYLKDGKPSERDDPSECVVDGKYVRPLLDYNILFNDEQEKRMLLADTIQALQQDKQLVQEALEEARTQADACAKDIASTKTEKEGMQRERDIVAAHRKDLEKNLGKMEAWIAHLIEINQAMAGRIAKLQLEAVQRIDRRTREMAQSGAGRP